MKVAQNVVLRAQTAAGVQDTSACAKCSPWDTKPQPFPLCALEQQVDWPLQ